jgi:hypothetical protein
MKKYFKLGFVTEQDKVVSITINNAAENLTELGVNMKMEAIIASGAYKTKYGVPVTTKYSKFYEVSSTEYIY